MNNWLNYIRIELHQIYGKSYPRFLKAEMVYFASWGLIILLLFLSTQPYIIRTVSSWGMAGIIVIVLFIRFYIEKRYVKLNPEMEQKFRQTAYYRWIRRRFRVVLIVLTYVIGFALPDLLKQPQPISQAVSEYGYPVYLPTQLPFKPTKQYAEIKTTLSDYDIDVFYENGNTHLTVHISQKDKIEGEYLSLANATLKNGIKADYDEELDTPIYSLFWYQNGFRYELIYYPSKNEPKPNKEVLLNIANSFKPVHP